MRKRVLVLNSYTLTDRRAEDQVRISSFFEGLEQSGYARGHNIDVEIADSNSLYELEARTRRATEQGLDVIHAVGTPNAIVAAECGGGVPIVYYGAHPEGAGQEACRRAKATGMVLTLPFTQNYKRFRFIRKLFPSLKRLWVPFFEGTVFCQPQMALRHRSYFASTGSPWMPGTSPHIGFRSLASLCYIIGLEYNEFVYKDADHLRAGIESISSEQCSDVLMPYNDSVYCDGAPAVLTGFAVERNIPLFWNNNTEATQLGAVAAISGCFREAGLATGRMAAEILDGVPPQKIQQLVSTKTYGSLNMPRARTLGLKLSDEVVASFDEVISA